MELGNLNVGFSNTFNCFLDDLMEENVLFEDVNLGVDPGKVSSFTELKASPSHESDSGYSTMTSPTHSVSSIDDGTTESNNMLDIDSVLDCELVNYISNGEISNDSTAVGRALNTPVWDVKSDEENETSLSVVNNGVSPVQTVNRRETRSSVKSSQSQKPLKENVTNTVEPKLPSVKVIKVIKTPATCSTEDTQDQIYEALEHRNRKNAIQAKQNREKKKIYIKSLEENVEQLKSENETLKESCDKLSRSQKVLEEEVQYLRNVLANESSLSKLLQNIPNVKNVKLSSSFTQRKRSIENDHDYQSPKRSRNTAGVCLHVNKENVSLEFCSKCSDNAQGVDDK